MKLLTEHKVKIPRSASFGFLYMHTFVVLAFVMQILFGLGGLIFLKPDDYGGALQFAATASFLSKLYSDYLSLLQRSGGSCGNGGFSRAMLRRFAMSQVSSNF